MDRGSVMPSEFQRNLPHLLRTGSGFPLPEWGSPAITRETVGRSAMSTGNGHRTIRDRRYTCRHDGSTVEVV
eukprot:48767-Eustigmatos_ZCMA.PRE.1